jgi:hypothetical protein
VGYLRHGSNVGPAEPLRPFRRAFPASEWIVGLIVLAVVLAVLGVTPTRDSEARTVPGTDAVETFQGRTDAPPTIVIASAEAR